ncbi:reverse transcriptase domain-containing protein [Tanacetum coccineum]
MRTRSSGPVVKPSTTPRRRRNKKRSQQQVDPTIVEEKPVVTMADTRTMAELLRAPTEGNTEAIVVPRIPAEHFELNHSLLNLVTSKQYSSFEKEDPHAHISWILLEKEPPRSITTWDDLVSKRGNRFKDLLRACWGGALLKRVVGGGWPHHGFTELHQLDTFYNSLNPTDQDSLNSATGGNLLEKSTQDALKNIKNKSKVLTSRNKPVVAKVNTNTSTSSLSPDVAALTDTVKALLLKNTTPPLASVKAVKESCVTCRGPHPYYQCPATNGNAFPIYQDNIQAYVSAAAATMLQQNNKLENMLSSYFQMNKPSSSGPLSSNTVTNPKGDLKAITTRSGVSYDGPPIPPLFPFSPKVVERDPENLLRNKEKLFEVANTPVNENCLAVILKKFPEKLGDPGKFLIPCNFSECLALADLGASINLMPLSIWKKLSLPELTLTQMILDLADRSTTRPTGIAEDVFVRVGNFHFPADFIVVDYVVDPRVPLILGRPFLRTARAMMLVYENSMWWLIHTPFEPIIAKSSPSLTPFKGGDFILEEIEGYLASDSVPPGIDSEDISEFFSMFTIPIEGDICLLEKFLNNDPSSPLLPKEIKAVELKNEKSSVNEPPEH